MNVNIYTTDHGLNKILMLLYQTTQPKRRFKPLTFHIPQKTGRSFGRIVSPRRSTYYNYIYRNVDYKRTIFPGQKGLVYCFKHSPRRFVSLSLVCYPIGFFAHILTPDKLKIGDSILNRCNTPLNVGDSSILSNFPSGSLIHNIGLYPHSRAQIIRSAGTFAILIRHSHNYVLLKLKSGEIRYYSGKIIATKGVISGEDHFIRDYKKAGTKRCLGKRPRTRPSAMNPVDHPMGGRTRGGKQATNPKGIITLNRPTVKTHHPSILYTKRQLKLL